MLSTMLAFTTPTAVGASACAQFHYSDSLEQRWHECQDSVAPGWRVQAT